MDTHHLSASIEKGVFRDDGKYFNPIWFAVMGPFTPFLITGILFAINAGETYGKKIRNIYLIVLCIASATFITALYLIVPKIDAKNSSIFGTINTSMSISFFIIQRKQYQKWRSNGGKPKSILIPMISAVVLFALLLWGTIANNNSVLEYKIGQSTIYFNKNVPNSEVSNLGNCLLKKGFFTEEDQFRYKIEMKNNEYYFLCPIKSEYINSTDVSRLRDTFNSDSDIQKSMSRKVLFIQSDDNYKQIPYN